MKKSFHKILGVSILPALLVMPAMADVYYTWAHPGDIDSYAVINGDIDYTIDGGEYNFITGTAMRNVVNGNVNLVLDGVTQRTKANGLHVPNDGNPETNVFGSVFVPSTTTQYLSTSDLGVETPTDEQKEIQQWVNGDVNVTVKNNSVIENSVIGVNFYLNNTEITESGLSGKTTVTIDNSTVNHSVRGTNYRDWAQAAPTKAKVGDIELNINDSLIKEEVVSAGAVASAGNVVINVNGNSVIGYTTRDATTKTNETKDNWIIAGANRKGATIDSTTINLNTKGTNNTIKIAGDVQAGSRDRGGADSEPAEGSVLGNATLNMFGGGNVVIGGDVRAFHVAGDTTLNLYDINATVAGTVKEFGTINIDEDAKLIADTLEMKSDGVVNLVLADDGLYSNIDVQHLKANGATLNMNVKKAGTYDDVVKVASTTEEGYSDFTWNLKNALFELSRDEGTITATKKSVEEIASGTGMNAESAVAVSHIADVAAVEEAPAQLRELSVKLQEKLAGGDTAAVEHATKAIHPETESVSRSVSSSVQNTVVNVASARMALPAVGRNGGDVNLTSGGVWAQGLFNKSKQNDSFRGYTRGIAAGIDGTINKVWTIGAGYSFAHSDISGSARDTEIDSNTVFVYGQYKPSAWYINAVANYTMSDYSEKGTVIDDELVFADYDVDSFGGTVATGYDFANGITPELGLRYMHVNTSDYTNTYGIKTSMKDTDFLTGILGAKYAFNVVANKHLTFAPQLNAGVKYDFLSDKSASTVAMPGIDAYTLNGTRLNRLGGEFGIGLGMQYDALQVSLNYDIDVRKDYTSQTGMLKFRYNF